MTNDEVLQKAMSQYGFFTFGGVCNNGCTFCCYNDERKNKFSDNASINFQISRRTIPEPLEKPDLLKYLNLFNPNLDRIFMSGAFCDAEPFTNPYFFEVLDLLEEKYPDKKKCFYTSAKTITPDIAERLSKYDNLAINASIMTFNLENKNRFLANKTDNENLVNFLVTCAKQIDVPLFFWYDDIYVLESDVDILYSLSSEYKKKPFFLRCFEYTRYSNPINIPFFDKAHASFNEAIAFGFSVANEFVPEVRTIPQDWEHPKYHGIFNRYIKEFDQLLSQVVHYNSTFVVSESMAGYALKKYPQLNWVVAKNGFYGGSVTSSKLLSVKDVVQSLPENSPEPIITAIMLDKSGRDEAGESFSDYGYENINVLESYE